MFIQVLLLRGYPQPLLYTVPYQFQQAVHIGTIVRVPLQQRVELALVTHICDTIPQPAFTVKDIQNIEILPYDTQYIPFLTHLATYYQSHIVHYIKRMYQFIMQRPTHEIIQKKEETFSKNIILTEEQQIIVDTITAQMQEATFHANLLHGVTGSGKTEVYKKLLLHAYNNGKVALLLLPEVTLALQFEQLLQAQMPSDIHIHSFHCGSSTKSKKTVWQRLMNQQPVIIIGVHLPCLLPLPHLGLIIVDEEHESGYQEKKHPKTNSKEAALIRAHIYQIPILLGSATPSMSSLYNVKHKGWHFFQLKKRFTGTFPTVKIVALNDHKQRRSFWLSRELCEEIQKRLACNEQTILFLNRRGHSFFVQCKQCSYIFNCKNCSVSLTLHDENKLLCHYCGFCSILPASCINCKVDEKNFLKKGVGTQQLMAIVQKLFPQARIARADMDISVKKKEWQETITKFHNRELDILIGTQTITKGYHFVHVTLVGIIWADLNLHFPRYNATESTLQQLIQVAGRAGRQTNNSLVIVQTLADHNAFNYLKEIDYIQFYQHEIALRAEVNYPPCIRLVEIELKHARELIVDQEATRFAQALLAKIGSNYPDVKLLGPAKPPISKIKNTHSRILFLKHTNMHTIQQLYQDINQTTYKSSIFFTPNPQ